MPDTRTAPNTIKQWRLHKKLTLETVAGQLGVSPSTVHKWETGKAPLTLDALQLLAGVYGAEPAALLFPPECGEMVELMRLAHAVLKSATPDLARQWLGVGKAMINSLSDKQK